MYERPILQVNNGEIKFNLFPKQAAFVNSDIDDLFFGGQVGPGKSTALLVWAAMRRLQYPGSSGILFRRTFRELENSLILKSKEIYRPLGAVYNENKKCWTFPGGSTQFFGFCDADGDVYQYQTAEFQDMGFDELTHFSYFQFNYLLTRTRSAIPGMKVQIRSASNPGNIGNDWVKKRYVDPAKVSGIWKDHKTNKILGFIPASLTDNPALMENDPGYRDRLQDLRKVSEKKYLALAEGRWDQPEGVYFTEWTGEPGHNVLTYKRIPDSYTMKFLSLDWGFADPACVLWWEVTPMGRIFIYREYYGTRLSPKELAEKIISMCPEGEKYMYMSASPEIWGKRVETENGGEVIQQLIQVGLGDRIIMQKANNARIPGWLKIREYLASAPDGKPWVQISPNCENLIRTLPSLIHDDREGHAEDVGLRCEDHACLIGSTKVLTKDGIRAIVDLVGTTGKIWTPAGWKKYSDCRKTRSEADIMFVKCEEGLSLMATPDHRVLTNHGWKAIEDLESSDLLERTAWRIQSNYLQRFRNSLVSVIINVDSISRNMANAFIGLFGNITMVQYPLATMSTMPMGIDSTTRFEISNFSKAKNILVAMGMALPWNRKNSVRKIFYLKPSLKPQNGTEIQEIAMPTLLLVKKHGRLLSKENRLKKFAKSAGPVIKHIVQHGLDFVIRIARCVGNEKIIQKLGPISWHTITHVGSADVYNLEVEDIHCFAVDGGIVVHNCESMRYGITSINSVPKSVISPHMSGYEKIFGVQQDHDRNFAYLPSEGKYGYGR